MSINPIIAVLALCCFSTPSFSQTTTSGVDCDAPANKDRVECICEDSENANKDECLALPPATQEATNFVGLIGPLLGGVGALGALAGGGGGTTTTTTATTSTN